MFFRLKGIQFLFQRLARVTLLFYRCVKAPQTIDRISGMRVQEHDSVCLVRGHESCQLAVCAWAELVRSIAVRSAVFRHCLKIRRSGTAAAMANQYDFRDPGLASEDSHRCPYVEGTELPIHGRCVVVESRVRAHDA